MGFPSLFSCFLSDEVTKQELAVYINDGTTQDFLDTLSLGTAWLAAEEAFIVIKEGDDALSPLSHQQLDSSDVLFEKESF